MQTFFQKIFTWSVRIRSNVAIHQRSSWKLTEIQVIMLLSFRSCSMKLRQLRIDKTPIRRALYINNTQITSKFAIESELALF